MVFARYNQIYKVLILLQTMNCKHFFLSAIGVQLTYPKNHFFFYTCKCICVLSVMIQIRDVVRYRSLRKLRVAQRAMGNELC